LTFIDGQVNTRLNQATQYWDDGTATARVSRRPSHRPAAYLRGQ